MIKIVSFKICPFVQRVTALLEAKGLDYQVEYISLSDKPQWYLDISPNGQVPVMVTEGDVALFESEAIIEYIEEAYALLEANVSLEQKALNRAWSYLAAKNYLVQCGTMRSRDAETLAEKSAKLGTAFDKIEAALGDGPFFGGEQIGVVDIAWLVLLHRAQIIKDHTGYDFLEGRPKTQAWQAAIMETGLAQKAVAEDFEEAFTNFYLADVTYLGRGMKDAAPQVAAAGGVERQPPGAARASLSPNIPGMNWHCQDGAAPLVRLSAG